jgi:hypothetical protein
VHLTQIDACRATVKPVPEIPKLTERTLQERSRLIEFASLDMEVSECQQGVRHAVRMLEVSGNLDRRPGVAETGLEISEVGARDRAR